MAVGWGEGSDFYFSGDDKVTSSPLVFVGSGGVTRGFGVLNVRMWNVLASGDDLGEEELFEERELVSLFGVLTFGWGNLFPGGSLVDVEDEGGSPSGGDEE